MGSEKDLEQNLQKIVESGAKSYTSDSREAENDGIFVALEGEKADGHQFVAKLLQAGGLNGVVVRRAFAQAHPELQKAAELVVCEDTHQAHRLLAKIFRKRFQGTLVAVGGSSGKTSTKEFLFQLLSASLNCIKTHKSQNGELGIPKTLESLRPGVEVAIIEVGIDGPGDMARHMEIVQPDVGVLTSIGEEHLNLLKSMDGVFAEERLLFDAVWARGGQCFGPAEDAYLKRFVGRMDFTGTPARPEQLLPTFRSPLTHPYALQNAALACAVALHLRVDPQTLLRAAASLTVPEGRGQVYELRPDWVLLADHYNSNPASLKGGLVFARQESQRRQGPLSLILGDMLDLGADTLEWHEKLLPEIIDCAPRRLWLVGSFWTAFKDRLPSHAEYFSDSAQAAQAFRPEDWSGVVLLKGSRGIALEKILEVATR